MAGSRSMQLAVSLLLAFIGLAIEDVTITTDQTCHLQTVGSVSQQSQIKEAFNGGLRHALNSLMQSHHQDPDESADSSKGEGNNDNSKTSSKDATGGDQSGDSSKGKNNNDNSKTPNDDATGGDQSGDSSKSKSNNHNGKTPSNDATGGDQSGDSSKGKSNNDNGKTPSNDATGGDQSGDSSKGKSNNDNGETPSNDATGGDGKDDSKTGKDDGKTSEGDSTTEKPSEVDSTTEKPGNNAEGKDSKGATIIAPFGKEDTSRELQNHAARTQDTLVDAIENAEVAEIKRSIFRSLTRLRAAEIKEFDTIARLETSAIDEYNDNHHYRKENPLEYVSAHEPKVSEDKYTAFHS